jgi:hypothetical protein
MNWNERQRKGKEGWKEGWMNRLVEGRELLTDESSVTG